MKKIMLSMFAFMVIGSSLATAGGDLVEAEVVSVVVQPESVTNANFYAGLAYSFLKADVDDVEKGNTYMLLAGYNFNPYVAVEGRYMHTFGSEMDVEGVGPKERKVTNKAIYVKPQYTFDETFTTYALLGYGKSIARYSEGNGVQFGLGINFVVVDNISIFADFTSLYSGDIKDVILVPGYDLDSKISSSNLGFTYSF
ncbi:MAG: porin family protein [Campylobacterota bacterium]|nr:porin family protein [Campylobacterota bacterium]